MSETGKIDLNNWSLMAQVGILRDRGMENIDVANRLNISSRAATLLYLKYKKRKRWLEARGWG